MSNVSRKDCAKMVVSDWKCAIDDRGGIKGILTFIGKIILMLCGGFIAMFIPLWLPHVLFGGNLIFGGILALVIYFIEILAFVFATDVYKKCKDMNKYDVR